MLKRIPRGSGADKADPDIVVLVVVVTVGDDRVGCNVVPAAAAFHAARARSRSRSIV